MSFIVKALAGNHPKYAARLIREFQGHRILNAAIGRASSAPVWAQGADKAWRQAAAELQLDSNTVYTFLQLAEKPNETQQP